MKNLAFLALGGLLAHMKLVAAWCAINPMTPAPSIPDPLEQLGIASRKPRWHRLGKPTACAAHPQRVNAPLQRMCQDTHDA